MNKVLFFASDYKIGLSSLLTDELIAFHRQGLDVLAVAGESEQEKGLSDKINSENDIKLIRIQGLDAHACFGRLVKRLTELIQENGTHIVHVQNNWQLVLMACVKLMLLMKFKINIVYTLHGFRHNSIWKSIIAKIVIGTLLFLFADRIICMSSYLKKQFNLLSYKIELLPLGVPPTFFASECPFIPKKGLHMIFPAQFRYGKNQDIIIKAFAEHIHRTHDCVSTLTLPGAGEFLPRMQFLTKELGISDRVFFPGLLSKEEIRQRYLASNVGIVSSNCETFGQSIVEPFVLGRCVLSTPVGIANDIIRNGINGFIFHNEKELATILTDLYNNPSLVQQIGKNNFHSNRIFQWDDISKKYELNIVRKLCGND